MNNKEQVTPEQKYDERRRAFLKKAAIVAAATPLITTLLMGQNSAYASNQNQCCGPDPIPDYKRPCNPQC